MTKAEEIRKRKKIIYLMIRVIYGEALKQGRVKIKLQQIECQDPAIFGVTIHGNTVMLANMATIL